jgi:hypothetical protein
VNVVVALRVAAGLLAAVWAVLFFALIDLSVIFLWNDDFVEVRPLEASWGAFLTFFMVVPLVVVAVRPRRYGEAVMLASVTTVALIIGAALSGDARPLWLAGAAAVSSGVLILFGTSLSRRAGMPPPVPHIQVSWPMAVLAVAGVPLWWPYIAHAASAQDVLPGDDSLGIDHWPVQAAAGVAVVLAAFLAAALVEVRVLATVAAAVSASAIGVSMAAGPQTSVATETPLWSVLTVMWGTLVALALAAAMRTPRRVGAENATAVRPGAAPATDDGRVSI